MGLRRGPLPVLGTLPQGEKEEIKPFWVVQSIIDTLGFVSAF